VYLVLTRFGPKLPGLNVTVNIHLTSVSAELQSATLGSVLLVSGKIGKPGETRGQTGRSP